MPPALTVAAAAGLRLRAMTDDDLPFVEALYASTRAEEVAQTGWPAQLQADFLHQQFAAQHSYWQANIVGLECWIVEHDAVPVGRLYLREQPGDLRVVDIALLPAARGHGWGAALMRDVGAHAARRGCKVSIHVEQFNPARRLYDRLGFVTVESGRGVYDLLEWQPVAS